MQVAKRLRVRGQRSTAQCDNGNGNDNGKDKTKDRVTDMDTGTKVTATV